jgi:segregation and condensation protein B
MSDAPSRPDAPPLPGFDPAAPEGVEWGQLLRMVEALLFAATAPLDEATLAARLPAGADVPALLADLARLYAGRGITLVHVGNGWALRTAPDLAFLLCQEVTEERRLSRAALETLAIIAYHQPVSRAEIEDIRGVAVSKGTLDLLIETGWVAPFGRREAPGRPMTYGTTEAFLVQFNLPTLDALPDLAELRAAGLLDRQPPTEDGSEDGGADEAE